MIIKDRNINVETAIDFADTNDLILKRRKNNLLLSDYQIGILEKYGFNYENYTDLSSLLFDINTFLNNSYNDEIDLISSQLDELLYYSNWKK